MVQCVRMRYHDREKVCTAMLRHSLSTCWMVNSEHGERATHHALDSAALLPHLVSMAMGTTTRILPAPNHKSASVSFAQHRGS